MMITKKRNIDRCDILNPEDYAAQRSCYRAKIITHKKNRRLTIGPNITLHFESYATMLYQVQEMLHIERGGDEQLKDELKAYNSLIPKGNEFVCTLMIEYENPKIRAAKLAELGGIEKTITLKFNNYVIQADWEKDIDRTTPDGKTSSIHFLHFRLTPEQAIEFRNNKPGLHALIAIRHPEYIHTAVIPEFIRAELNTDL